MQNGNDGPTHPDTEPGTWSCGNRFARLLARTVAFLADSWAGCAVILLIPWPLSYTPLWMVLLRWWYLIAFAASGVLMLARGNSPVDGQAFALARAGVEHRQAPWMIKSGMMLRLRSDSGKRNIYGWQLTAWTKPNGGIYGDIVATRDAKIKMTAKHMC